MRFRATFRIGGRTVTWDWEADSREEAEEEISDQIDDRYGRGTKVQGLSLEEIA